jgi:hypothetical protein
MILSEIWSPVNGCWYTELDEIKYRNGIFILPNGTEFDSVASFLKKCTFGFLGNKKIWEYIDDGITFIVFAD